MLGPQPQNCSRGEALGHRANVELRVQRHRLARRLGIRLFEDHRVTAGDQNIDLWQYDLGAELRAPSWLTSGAWDFTPFIGLGGGGRTYNYRDLDVDAKTNVAGYGTLGGEIGFGLIGLRIEGRDYVSQFKPFDGGDSKTRNDVTVAAGLTLRF